VIGTSAVGQPEASSAQRKSFSANFGSCRAAHQACAVPTQDTAHHLPVLAARPLRSSIRLIRARSASAWPSRVTSASGQSAPSARCRSGQPLADLQVLLAGPSPWRGVPQRRTSMFCRLHDRPSGSGATVDWGKASSWSRRRVSRLFSSSSKHPHLALLRRCPGRAAAWHLRLWGASPERNQLST